MSGRCSGFLKVFLLGAMLSLGLFSPAIGQTTETEKSIASRVTGAMAWRNIGPFRGGRVTATVGVRGNPLIYYMGATGGGVWKTEDAGLTWRNITDGQVKTGSVGAIAVAESDPNVIFVGMGEAPVRGVATSHGDGVYKSTDAGKTWKHVGLDQTRHISQILIHPKNPDLAYVAAQGSPWAPTPDRGVYRTTDGGKTWSKVHFVDNSSGVSDLAMDAANPRIVFAAYWDHQRTPWKVRSGGPGSGLYKSTDGGDTWQKLTEGLPKSVMGKIAVAVSPANPDRVWTLIEAEDGGLFRSDDGGKTFRKITDDRLLRARAWYYINVFADPRNADTVYVLNAPVVRSIDGGRTFQPVPTPHGDNHSLWINPDNPLNMINGNDGGACVTFNGGRTWSTQDNQPTAQFYRVNADNLFPYNVYGGQQDNTSVRIASRQSGGRVGQFDFDDVGGCESAYVAFDPDNPTLIYAGCYQGIISEYDSRTKHSRNVMAYPALGLAEPSNEQKYRFNWNAPIVVSKHNPNVIYHAGNVLLKSENRGQTWTPISPDLTRNDKTKQGPGGGPITNEGAGGEVYNTIFYVAESPHDAGTIWVGADDGLVHVTRDGGRNWSNVTPPQYGADVQVNAIEVSPHDPATAYLAVTGYKLNDFTPRIYLTTDYGKTWKEAVKGIAPGDFVRVVREDPARRGLLYAGTETGMYLSFDGGQNWERFQLNLPVVPVTDLKVHGKDLVASTQGRAFWVLDDLTPLRQIQDAQKSSDAVVLMNPGKAVQATGFPNDGGAGIAYFIPKALESGTKLTIEILDATGKVIRAYGTERRAAEGGADGQPGPPPTVLTTRVGLNKVTWDFRTENIKRIPGIFINGSTTGYRVAPGTYQVRLKVGDKTVTQPLEVAADPRFKLAEADERARQEMLAALHARVNEMHEAVIRLRDAREQIAKLVERSSDLPDAKKIADAAGGLTPKLTAWEERIVQPKQKTFQDVINFRNHLNAHFLNLSEAVDGSYAPITEGMRKRFDDLTADWSQARTALDALLEKDLPAFNAMVKEAGVPAVAVKPIGK